MSTKVNFCDDLVDLLGDDPLPMEQVAPSRSPAGPLTPAKPLRVVVPPPAAEGLPDAIPAIMDEAALADLLGLVPSQVRTKARDGILIRAGRGKYDVRASLQGYIERLRHHASRVGKSPEGGTGDELKAEKLRLARQQADKLELSNAAARGELVQAAAVERAWADLLRDVRAGMLATSSRCGAALPHLTAYDVATIDREIRRGLEALGNGN
ncbi:hypothetical protein RNZ50_23965 [Paracoccaceae bacterium Fryx2]|nr:hypothetical protein [Paracoccaceae bacterium Fryx2]